MLDTGHCRQTEAAGRARNSNLSIIFVARYPQCILYRRVRIDYRVRTDAIIGRRPA